MINIMRGLRGTLGRRGGWIGFLGRGLRIRRGRGGELGGRGSRLGGGCLVVGRCGKRLIILGR